MSEEPKPCPFCGSKPDVQEYNDGFVGIGCSNGRCYIHPNEFWFPSMDDAVEKWNKRAERTCHNFGGEEGTNGEWYDFACDACGYCCDQPEPNYCPNCGAKVVYE